MQIEKFQELYQLEYTVISVSFFIIGTYSKSVQGDIQFQFYLLQYFSQIITRASGALNCKHLQ